MAEPLALLKQRAEEDWLMGYSGQDFADLAEKYYQEIIQAETPPTILLSDRDPIRFLARFIAACSAPCRVFLCNPDWGETEWQQVFDLVEPDSEMDRSAAHSFTLSDRSLIMIPTGGTSGKLRFAMHTWDTLTASVEGFRQYFEVNHVHSCCVLPLYHVSGLMQWMRSFISGGKLAILPWKEFEISQKLDIDPQNFFLSLVPTQLQRLLDHPVTSSELGRFRAILLGGAPAWTALLEKARSLKLSIAPTYGMTETASQIATLKPEAFLQGQPGCGQVLPHAQITILSETGKSLQAGQIGQISIQAKSFMLGYYPKFFDRAIYQPDDLGFFDAEGYLHIIGRNSNKIITGGENVFPAEVEAVIRATNLVQDVCVMGVADPNWGQMVTAIYVPKDQTLSSQKLLAEIDHKLSKFKCPKHWVSVEQLPRNAQGKINYEFLQQLVVHHFNFAG